MEQLFFDRIVKLLVTCPHFRGLNLLIDIVDGYEIYSAPNILGILPGTGRELSRRRIYSIVWAI